MDTLTKLLNNYINRLVIAFIFSAALASPYLNGFTESSIWLVLGVVLFGVILLTCITGHKLNKWTVRLLVIIFTSVIIVVFTTWYGY